MNIQEVQQKLQALPDKLVDDIILIRLSAGVIAIIRDRVNAGQYLEGSSPNAGQYSTTPMPLPFGKLEKAVSKKELQNKDKYTIFTAKSGNKWVIIQGGYKEYRRLCGKESDKVVMSWTGKMMQNLGIVEKVPGSIGVGFSDPDMERLAIFHNISGVGKSHRRHVFFDLSKEERAQLTKYAGEEITKELIKAFQ